MIYYMLVQWAVYKGNMFWLSVLKMRPLRRAGDKDEFYLDRTTSFMSKDVPTTPQKQSGSVDILASAVTKKDDK